MLCSQFFQYHWGNKTYTHKIFRVYYITPLKIFKFNWWGNMWPSERGKFRTRSLLGNSKAVWLSRHLRDSFIFQSHLTWIPSLVDSYISITFPLSYKTHGDLQKAYVSTHHVSTSEPGFLDVCVSKLLLPTEAKTNTENTISGDGLN